MYKHVKLSKIADVTTGFPFKGDLYTDKGIRVVRGENVTVGSLRWDSIKCWNREFEQFDKYLLKEGDVVIGMDGSKVGKNRARIKLTDLPLLLAQRIACIRSNELSNQGFLYYLIMNDRFVEFVARIQTGSSVPHISQKQIEKFTIPSIPIDIQRKISELLLNLDSKIEINNRINTELEAMAKMIYDYWFVQFDFPNAKGKPYKSSGGKMVWNDELKREIPDGWEMKKLGELGEFKNGINYDPSIKGNTEARIINVRNISSSTWFISQYDLDAIVLERKDVENYLVTDKDILIARSGIPGATRVIQEYVQNTIYCGFIIRYQIDVLVNKTYLFFCLKDLEHSTTSKSAGTIMQNVNQDTLKRMSLVMPDESLISYFNKVISPIFQKLNNNLKENQKLSELRDWLLPMLMNGQVKVT